MCMGNMYKDAKLHLFFAANTFRKEPTPSEKILWLYLRKKPLGIKFRRQHPYLLYVLDFYAHSIKLVIEVDGSIHELEDVIKKDLKRQKDIERTGLHFLRIKNKEIQEDINVVMLRIENTIRKLILPPL